MAKNKSLYSRYVDKMESIKDPYFKNVNEDLFNGQNSYLRLRMKGSSFFNDEWVKAIENCVYELGQIVNNPLEVTKTEGELTPVELAKKINYESIQHLSSHSQYVKDIDEEGNVVPAKILSQFHKEEIHTYENRFIATFIRRLVLFVEKRYEFIKTTVNFDTKDVMYIKNKSIVDGEEVTIETKVTKKKQNEDAQSKIGREFVKRVEDMRRYVNYFYNSPFMKELKTEKNVRKPILQTNIIRKNPLYHKCYETFLFIERFSQLGVEYSLDSHYQEFSEKERKALNYILTSNLLSLEATEKSKVYKKSNKTYKPKLLSSCDDEIFTYGDLVKGPIEFVRVDEKYTEWLNAQVSTKIPPKPNKVEREYFKEELELKKNTKKHINEVDLLLRRIRRQIAKWEKLIEKYIEQRNIEEAKELEAQLAELRKEEQDILDRKREEIIKAAQADKIEIKKEELAKIEKEKEEARLREEEIRKAIEEAALKAHEEVLAEEAAKAAEEEAKQEETKVEEPVIEEQPVQEEVPAEEPVIEEPQKEEQPAQETLVEEPVAEEVTPVEETIEVAVVEEVPVEEPAPVEEIVKELPVEEVPVEEPVVEEQSAQEIAPEEEAIPEPVAEEVVVEEQPVVEETKPEEKPAPKKRATKKSPAKKSTTKKTSAKKKVEEQPAVIPVEPRPEPEPQPEPVLVEQPQEVNAPEAPVAIEPAPAIEPKVEPEKKTAPKKPAQSKKSTGKAGENDKPKAKKTTKKPAKKPAKKVEKPEVKEKPVHEEPTTVFAKIPGRFIVKSNKGYVISKTEFTNVKSQARVFDDFNDARRYKTMFGGKVIKL